MGQAKKILITTGIFPPAIGGPALFAKNLAEKLAEKNQVTILTYASAFKKPLGSSAKKIKIKTVWRHWPWGWRHLLYGLKVTREARRHQQILVLNVLHGGWPLIWTKKPFLVRVVGDRVWEMAVNRNQTSLLIDDWQKEKKEGLNGWLAKKQTQICQKAQKIIVPSHYLANLVTAWGVDPQKITVIYNGVNFPVANLEKENARRQIGIAGHILLSVGRLVPWKGFRLLIKLMPRFLELNPFFRLVIMGEGPEKPALEKIVKNLRLEKKVVLVGRQSPAQLAIYLAAAEIFILNTGYEGFSHQILEAMQAGVPVVTTASGGNREVVRQGENGFMIRYNDEFNLYEAVKALWQYPEMRERFSEEGKKTAAQFSWEKCWQEWEKTLNS